MELYTEEVYLHDMLDGKLIKVVLLQGKFVQEHYEDESSIAYSRYDPMEPGKDAWAAFCKSDMYMKTAENVLELKPEYR